MREPGCILRHGSIRRSTVLVACELYRGISPNPSKGKAQRLYLDKILAQFSVKPLTNANVLAGAKLYRHFKGLADSLIGAQCLEGGIFLVITNPDDFARMPGSHMAVNRPINPRLRCLQTLNAKCAM